MTDLIERGKEERRVGGSTSLSYVEASGIFFRLVVTVYRWFHPIRSGFGFSPKVLPSSGPCTNYDVHKLTFLCSGFLVGDRAFCSAFCSRGAV